jgi:hypothetical protein
MESSGPPGGDLEATDVDGPRGDLGVTDVDAPRGDLMVVVCERLNCHVAVNTGPRMA